MRERPYSLLKIGFVPAGFNCSEVPPTRGSHEVVGPLLTKAALCGILVLDQCLGLAVQSNPSTFPSMFESMFRSILARGIDRGCSSENRIPAVAVETSSRRCWLPSGLDTPCLTPGKQPSCLATAWFVHLHCAAHGAERDRPTILYPTLTR
jgi:hypothetical protein